MNKRIKKKRELENSLRMAGCAIQFLLEQQNQAIKDLQAKEGASEESKQQLADLQAQFDQYKLDSDIWSFNSINFSLD
ncbi:hypothetical protein [Streptococcus sp. DD12]|uniref:hypothetical protein n=1 Tax=Streptococcus sp. DD12 TaxID=1777880 RepID=UPI0007986460|nr:hypothetical protein [Streptococcus sp. DD12]KXT76641.1 hypothetical protein STRDD12_00279 [Streptococcus sp. DD12]